MRAPLLGDDDYADIFRVPNDSEDQIAKKQAAQEASLLGPGHEYLRNLIAAGKVDNGFRGIIPFQDPALDVKISGEVQVLLDALILLSHRAASAALRRNADGKAIRAQIIRHSAAAPDEHGGGWVLSYINQNAIAYRFVLRGRSRGKTLRRYRHLGNFPEFQLMRGLPQSELP